MYSLTAASRARERVQACPRCAAVAPPADVLTCSVALHTSCPPHRGPACRSSHCRLQWPSASCTCNSVMHVHSGTPESSAPVQTAYPREPRRAWSSARSQTARSVAPAVVPPCRPRIPSVREREPEQSSRTAEPVLETRTWNDGSKTAFIATAKQLVPRSFARFSFRVYARIGPNTKPPSMTDSVTSQGEKPRAPPAGGRRGHVESFAHAYATCAVMSGLDKGP